MNAWARVGGAAGIVFVILTVLGGFVQGDVPVYSDGPVTIKTWFAENSDQYLIGFYLISIGSLFYLWFLATLVSTLSGHENTRPWNMVALLGGVHLLVAAQASLAFDGTMALLEGDLSDDLARTLSAGDYMTFLLAYFFAGILVLAVSVILMRTRLFWAPLAWFGPLITVGGIVAIAAPLEHDAEGALTVVGYGTLITFLAWTLGISFGLIWSSADVS
jgi:hypothetical protein